SWGDSAVKPTSSNRTSARVAGVDRRVFLTGAGALAAAAPLLVRRAFGQQVQLTPGVPAGTVGEAVLDTLAGKKPLIRLSERPPNYETPLSFFNEAITPNDGFFVRYHLAQIPMVNATTWRLKLTGEVNAPVEYDLAGLRSG